MPLTTSDITKIRALIREELAVLAAQSLVHAGGAAKPTQTPKISGPDTVFNTYAEASAATGLTRFTLSMIKLASRGESDSPFTGRLTTARRLNRWLADHPQFIPKRIQSGGSDRK